MTWVDWLERTLIAFRREPERSLKGFVREPPSSVVNNYYIEKVVVVMDNSVTYGTRIQGDVNILGPVQDAFNTINNIDTSGGGQQQLKDLLKTLHVETTQLIEALQDKDEAQKAARNLRNLTEAVTAKKLDRKWFEVSAEGLLEAAQAVASLTAPVTAAVRAIFAFFKE